MNTHDLRSRRSPSSIRRRFLSWLSTCIAAAFWLTAAEAAPVSFEYSGTITSADPSTGVAAGTPFSGTFTYDPAAQIGGVTFEGYYTNLFDRSTPDTSNLTLNVGGHTFSNTNGLSIVEQYQPFPVAPPTITSMTVQTSSPQLLTSLTLQGTSMLASNLDDAGSLVNVLPLSNFSQANLQVGDRASGRGETLLAGTITSLTPVPEPSTLALPLLVGAGLTVRRWRRR